VRKFSVQAFYEPRHFDGNPMAGVIQRRHHFGLGHAGELRSGGNNTGDH
jgi:hypothetical protein